jgi:multimeric flavodoxin WrbA
VNEARQFGADDKSITKEVKMKVVAIGGSPRLQGNTNYLIDQALEELAKHGVETEKIVLNEYKIAPCQAHNNCGSFTECQQADDGRWIVKKFSEADGVIVASPVYFATISAQMKTFMDRTIFLFRHNMVPKARCAGIIAIAGRGGYEEAAKEMNKFFDRGQIKVITLKGPAGPPDSDPKSQTELIERARDMARQMAEVLTA